MTAAVRFAEDPEPPRRPRGPEHAEAAVFARLGSWLPAKAIESAMCNVRRGTGGRSCSSVVGVTQEALDALAVFNRQLAKRGENPLELDECFTCQDCAQVRAQVAEERSGARRARTQTAIRQLKGVQPASEHDEREALRWLEKVLGAGYVRELLTAITEAKQNKGGQRRGKAGDL